MTEVISVRFRGGCKTYYFDPRGVQVTAGEHVIVETAQGLEYAQCAEGNHEVPDEQVVEPFRPMVRIATDHDRRVLERNRAREKEAFDVCQKKILQHKLEMKLVRVECSFDGNKILFFFTADGRVDFRELVKDLASAFRARIELRQIGVRDEAKMLGGLGICGRPFCCAQFLDDFMPVSIKMAKTQSLSLNPTKISGTCGRLMCCLKYEQEAYEDLMKDAPRMDSFVETPDGAGTIISVNTLREKVRVRLDDAPDTLKTYHNSEIRVVRAGKGKRPEGYVQPPKEELAKLRKVTQSPEDQYRQEQAALAAALDQFIAEHEPASPPAEPSRRRGNRPAGPRPAEGEGEKRHRPRHHRSGSRPAPGHQEPAAPGGEPQEEAPRRRPNRSRRTNQDAAPKTPNQPGKTGEGKKSRGTWHRRNHRRPGGQNGGQGGGTPNTP